MRAHDGTNPESSGTRLHCMVKGRFSGFTSHVVVVRLRVVVVVEVVVIHHAITGPIRSHRISYSCMPHVRVSEGLPPCRLVLSRLCWHRQQGYWVSFRLFLLFLFFFHQIRWLPCLSLQETYSTDMPCISCRPYGTPSSFNHLRNTLSESIRSGGQCPEEFLKLLLAF